MTRVRTQRVLRILASRNMTQADLARHVGTTRSYLSQVLRGNREPGPNIRQRLMNALGVEFGDLFEFDSEKAGVR